MLLLGGAAPSALFANLSPGDGPEPSVASVERLQSVRETLSRRNAEERHVKHQVDVLGDRVATLQERRDQAARALDASLAEVARLERELDRLVPRLLISQRRAAERQRSSAQALASIASLSRASLAPETRARLRAISPIMLRRLQAQGSGLDQLEARAGRLIERHRRLSEAVPAAMATRVRLEMERDRTERQRAAAQRRLEDVAADLERLARREATMARHILRGEQARAMLVSITPERTLRTPRLNGPFVRSSSEAGLGKHQLEPGMPVAVRLAEASDPARIAAAVVGGPGGAIHGLQPSAQLPYRTPPPAKPSMLMARAEIVAHPEHAADRNGRSMLNTSIERSARLYRPSRPIVPAPDALLDPVLQAVDQSPVITMPARPGQEVAAPDAGRVAFGGGFGSYGLLLILEHEREYHTILWGFSELKVATGQPVEAGDIIGVMGGDGTSELRVEFRRNGRPVGVLPWLAASSSKVRG